MFLALANSVYADLLTRANVVLADVYKGRIAEAIAAAVQERGGVNTVKDLRPHIHELVMSAHHAQHIPVLAESVYANF